MEALVGFCLIIPCNFTATIGDAEFTSSRDIFGAWMINDWFYGTVVYNSSKVANIYPMNITGNLNQSICTTLFSNLTTNHTDSYYFRVVNWPFRASACANPVKITVKEAPQSPSIEIPGDLKEGDSVTVSCSAVTPCPHSPPKLNWTLQQDPHSFTAENINGSFTTKIQKTITLSEQHDGNNISCSASYPVDEGRDVRTAETRVTLRVSHAPKDTSASISPSGLVSAGSRVNLSCSSRAKPPVSSFTWFLISTDGAMNVSEGAVYGVNATHGAVYFCVAANALGNQTSPHVTLAVEAVALPCSTILAVMFGIILLICLILCVWCLKTTRHATRQTPSQTPATKGVVIQNICYSEHDFPKPKPEESPDAEQVGGQKVNTVYANVKVSNTESRASPTAGGPQTLYTQVKK